MKPMASTIITQVYTLFYESGYIDKPVGEGIYEGEFCGRDGCFGIIEAREKESCSCHINPPCSACTQAREFCPVCDWDSQEENNMKERLELKNNPPKELFSNYKIKTFYDLDNSKIDWIISNSWCSGMEIKGVYPEGTTIEQLYAEFRKKGIPIDKQSLPTLKYFCNQTFIYSYFTD